MKVVHVCNLPLTEDHPEYGKIVRQPGRWALNLAKAQCRYTNMQAECVVVIPGSKQVFVTEKEGVRIHYVPAPARFRTATGYFKEVRDVSRYIQSLSPHLIHAHGTECSNLKIAQRCSIPYVFTAQGMYFIVNARMRYPVFSQKRAAMLWEDLALKKCRIAIAKSDYVREELEKKFPQIRCILIPNTYDEDIFPCKFLDQRKRHLVFIGSIIPRKGADVLIEALETVLQREEKLTVHIFGNSGHPSPYEALCISQLRRLLGDRLILHGLRPANEVIAVLAEAKILAAPSREEMFGNQLIEALLSGTHAIVTDRTAMAENVRRFGNGTIIPQENAAALATAVEECLKTKTFPETESAVKNIKAYMGPKIVAERHQRLYEKILVSSVAPQAENGR